MREAFAKYQITYVTLVPLVLKNLQKGLQARFDELPGMKRRAFEALRKINIALTKDRPRLALSRRLLKQVHEGFGGKLEAIIVGGAFSEPQMLQFFYDLGIPVVNAYGLTEGGTGVTVNDLKPFRADTLGKPLPGIEVRIASPDADGIGEVAVHGKTVMAGYLNDPDMTAETIVDGWLMTGDMGRFDRMGHLQLFGRKKNMIVTEEGKNVYAEDVESAFEGLKVKEFCVFAANYIWPQRSMVAEKLILVIHLEPGQAFTPELKNEIVVRNNRLTNYKRFTFWWFTRRFSADCLAQSDSQGPAQRLGTLIKTKWSCRFRLGKGRMPFLSRPERTISCDSESCGGRGRAAKLAGEVLGALERKRTARGCNCVDQRRTRDAASKEAYQQGYRRFLAVGGDGTAHELVNGAFHEGRFRGAH